MSVQNHRQSTRRPGLGVTRRRRVQRVDDRQQLAQASGHARRHEQVHVLAARVMHVVRAHPAASADFGKLQLTRGIGSRTLHQLARILDVLDRAVLTPARGIGAPGNGQQPIEVHRGVGRARRLEKHDALLIAAVALAHRIG